jgi:hypothetical protein
MSCAFHCALLASASLRRGSALYRLRRVATCLAPRVKDAQRPYFDDPITELESHKPLIVMDFWRRHDVGFGSVGGISLGWEKNAFL